MFSPFIYPGHKFMFFIWCSVLATSHETENTHMPYKKQPENAVRFAYVYQHCLPSAFTSNFNLSSRQARILEQFWF